MEFDQFVGYVQEGADQEMFMRFLVGFGRIDYGIKCEGTFLVNGKIKWDVFSMSLPDDFFDVNEFGQTEFAQNPPAKWSQAHRRFEDESKITSTIQLIKGLNRFRNNLFHGSKGKLRDRDRVLCFDSQNIVRALYNACSHGNEQLQEIARWAGDVDGRYRDSKLV